MNLYENVFITKPELTEEVIEDTITKVKDSITSRGGNIINADNWGKKKLAYKVDNFRNGIYIVLTFELAPEKIIEIENQLKLNENIIKYITSKIDREKYANAKKKNEAGIEKDKAEAKS